ncbi:H+transporting two-sector ATPase subunit B/B' [Tistrella mobilis]|uniref:ATP synthase subunit b n=1 Tax=Tistrella mobilis (strain KA081020-065) TaxID=1110502 RepID=I3TPD1_TISMK|nr:H+transporting two-sector ATPase subunit B/B' [Tistrella mobilis]AFK54619.1 H+transporting two-sector ATPase B/B' subunit [Tistrella mobilis KA081020-065]MAM77224.1 F0F1 ATP synthase subunit B' [Tistrella sp.]
MPQFEPSTFASQIFWLVVSFGLLYLLMSKIALPRIADILEVRQDRIAADLDRAEALKREAEEARAAYEAALANARAEAQKLLEQAGEQAQAEAQRQLDALDERLAAKVREAEAAVAAAKADAMADLASLATETAEAATAKLAGAPVDGTAVRSAVDAALAATSSRKE